MIWEEERLTSLLWISRAGGHGGPWPTMGDVELEVQTWTL